MIDAFVDRGSPRPIGHAAAIATGADGTRVMIVSVQYLRAVAALMVLFHHGWDQLPWFKERFADFCDSGVDLFFVISGFIMVFVTSDRAATAAQFLKMRFIRIVPLYWIATVAASILLLILPGLFHSNELTVGHFMLSMLFVAHPNPVPPWPASPIIKLGWTLNYEMFFYVAFAAAIVLSPSRRVSILASAFVLVAAIGLTPIGGASLIAGFYTDSIILEFVFGMVIASLFLNGAFNSVGSRLGLLIVAGGAVGLWVGGHYDPALRGILFGVPAAAIVAGALALEAGGHVRTNESLLLLGNASYSVYLVHMFPLAVLRAAWSRADLPTDGIGSTFVFVAMCMIVGSVAGIASYLMVERPLLSVMRGAARQTQGSPKFNIDGILDDACKRDAVAAARAARQRLNGERSGGANPP